VRSIKGARDGETRRHGDGENYGEAETLCDGKQTFARVADDRLWIGHGQSDLESVGHDRCQLRRGGESIANCSEGRDGRCRSVALESSRDIAKRACDRRLNTDVFSLKIRDRLAAT